MKQTTLFFAFLISIHIAFAQDWDTSTAGQITYSSGIVGIGTNAPEHQLHIDTDTQSNVLVMIGEKVGSGGPLLLGSRVTSTEDIATYHKGGFLLYQKGGSSTNGLRRLHIGAREWSDSFQGGSQISFWTSPVNSGSGWDNAIERLTITKDGAVGIGTITPSEKLEVNGTIRSKEVKVEASGWPDYVFEEDYNLRSLKETEAYIKENKHLPEIPSANEIEANGVQLGEMNMLLLKKIEEMTLHQIEMMKQIKQLQSEIQELKSE